MRRTTILLEDDLADLLEYERRRQDRSVAAIVREALQAYLVRRSSSARPLPFAALGASGQHDTARRAEQILSREWTRGMKKPGRQRRSR